MRERRSRDWLHQNRVGTKGDFLADVGRAHPEWDPQQAATAFDEVKGHEYEYQNLRGTSRLGQTGAQSAMQRRTASIQRKQGGASGLSDAARGEIADWIRNSQGAGPEEFKADVSKAHGGPDGWDLNAAMKAYREVSVNLDRYPVNRPGPAWNGGGPTLGELGAAREHKENSVGAGTYLKDSASGGGGWFEGATGVPIPWLREWNPEGYDTGKTLGTFTGQPLVIALTGPSAAEAREGLAASKAFGGAYRAMEGSGAVKSLGSAASGARTWLEGASEAKGAARVFQPITSAATDALTLNKYGRGVVAKDVKNYVVDPTMRFYQGKIDAHVNPEEHPLWNAILKYGPAIATDMLAGKYTGVIEAKDPTTYAFLVKFAKDAKGTFKEDPVKTISTFGPMVYEILKGRAKAPGTPAGPVKKTVLAPGPAPSVHGGEGGRGAGRERVAEENRRGKGPAALGRPPAATPPAGLTPWSTPRYRTCRPA